MTTLHLKPKMIEPELPIVDYTAPRSSKTQEDYMADARAREEQSEIEDFSFRKVPYQLAIKMADYIFATPVFADVTCDMHQYYMFIKGERPETNGVMHFHDVPKRHRLLIHDKYGQLLAEFIKQKRK